MRRESHLKKHYLHYWRSKSCFKSHFCFWQVLLCCHRVHMLTSQTAGIELQEGGWLDGAKDTSTHIYTHVHVVKPQPNTHTKDNRWECTQRRLNGTTLQAASLLCCCSSTTAGSLWSISLSHTHTHWCPAVPSLWLMLLCCQFLAETALNVSIAAALNTDLQRTPAVAPCSGSVHQHLQTEDTG